MSTLYGKLSAVMLTIVVLLGLIFFVIVNFSTDLYYKEITQRLNLDLAQHIADEGPLISDGVVNDGMMKDLAHFAMVINPNIEVYLLGPDGEILAHAAPPGHVKRSRVALDPILGFLAAPRRMPMTGDDPRDPEGRKIFSAAEVFDNGNPAGYVYTILGGERYDEIASSLHGSYIGRLVLGAVVIAVVFAVAAGLIVFALLTRRLRRLNAHVERLTAEGFSTLREYPVPAGSQDELDRLAGGFNAMSHRIQEQLSQLEETDRLRRELISNVSHDLRTPLASMQGYIETLLVKDATLTPEERRQYLEIARKHSDRLRRLIAELFELAKLDSGNVRPQLESFSLSELLQDVGQEFQLAARKKDLQIEIESPAREFTVVADIGLMQRVLENLIENAIRYTPRGGSVRVALEDHEEQISVTVADTGCGIPADAMPHIFDRFYGTKERGDSTGLGLAIVKRIVDLHDGKIVVESEPEVGTRFTVDLPAGRAA